LGGAGNFDGTGTTASFNYPHGLAIDSTGNLYVADSGQDAHSDSTSNNTIRKINPVGVVSTLVGRASGLCGACLARSACVSKRRGRGYEPSMKYKIRTPNLY